MLVAGLIAVSLSTFAILNGRSLLENSARATVIDVGRGSKGARWGVYEAGGSRHRCDGWMEVGDTVLYSTNGRYYCKLESAVPFGSGPEQVWAFVGALLVLGGLGLVVFDRIFNKDQEIVDELAAIEAALREHDRAGG